ncbi:efflux RND transporter permease subunit [Vibrio rumoiensis]|uniref:Acriflavin resistance protein n=1 Tax=Vibrio rumoiensis 1S-45 TaxID=1188252 RepID=A0A1E5E3G4_9VIBR|nr:efflux RND transporter permease subunit [Vibrio rumoiensis]OEF26823.1 acriflavin resistance protein [Vibrio rumoiensis 1S-45]
MKAILNNSRLLILLIALLIVAGTAALYTLPRIEDPIISNRFANVNIVYPGSTAQRVEVLVTEPTETVLRKISEIKEVSSVSKDGISSITIELNDDITEPEPIWSKVRDKLSDVSRLLPQGAQEPIFSSDHTYPFSILTALTWDHDSPVNLLILNRYAKELAMQMRGVTGTEFVDEYGNPDEEVLINIHSSDMSLLQGSALSLSNKIQAGDAKNSAGELFNRQHRFSLELNTATDSLEALRTFPINTTQDGEITRLGDIATISHSARYPSSNIALINGQPGIIVATRMQPELRIDLWTKNIHEKLSQFEQSLPSNIKLTPLFSQQAYTEDRLTSLVKSMLLGLSLILLVLLFTLGWRGAVIVAISLPLTTLSTLAMMNFTGIPINQMSVTGLIVALGIMVDNAIVMVDTIQSYRQKGIAQLQASYKAVSSLWVPLLGSTLTTVLAFAPIFLMPGATGEFVGAIAITVSFSLLSSYVIAHTIIASLAGRFFPQSTNSTSQPTSFRWYQVGIRTPSLSRWFSHSIHWALASPLKTVLLMLVLPLSGFYFMSHLTTQFFPPADRDMFEIQVYMPPQSTIYATQDTAKEISQLLNKHTEIEQVNWMIGENFPAFYYNMVGGKSNTPNFAQAMVKVSDYESANRLIPELQNQVNLAFPQAQILVRKLEQGPPFNAPIEVRLFGPDLDKLKQYGEDIRLLMAQTPFVTHTKETLLAGAPKIKAEIKEESDIQGFTLKGIAQVLNASLTGIEQGSYIDGTESLPIRVRVNDSERGNLSQLKNLYLPLKNTDAGISFSSLADLSLVPTTGEISHLNGLRLNTIEGFVQAGVIPQASLDLFTPKLNEYIKSLPSNYWIEIGGESSERSDSVAKLMSNLLMVFTLMFVVVVLSFNSFKLSGIIFLVGFLSAGLGLLSIYIFNYPFGFTVIIGLLGVVGLAVNAAIVILAELKQDEEACNADKSAIVRGVLSCGRHITSTTITTVGGFIPLILAGGGFWPPFAIAIAGGTVLTTLLSFYLVPTLFYFAHCRQSKTKAVNTSDSMDKGALV